jgi:hypothetical protein
MAEESPTPIIDDATCIGEDAVIKVDEAEQLSSTTTQSALRDNISKKGKNAYYYAHAHKATGPEVGILLSIVW